MPGRYWDFDDDPTWAIPAYIYMFDVPTASLIMIRNMLGSLSKVYSSGRTASSHIWKTMGAADHLLTGFFPSHRIV